MPDSLTRANIRSSFIPLTVRAALQPTVTTHVAALTHVTQPNLRRFTTRSHPIHAATPSTPPAKHVSMSPIYSTRETGKPGTLDYRVWVTDRASGRELSAWHDIPLLADPQTIRFNYVNEIAKGTRAKFEIATKEAGNPIKQDVKKGSLRSFTYGDIPFNYGCLPQTWEDPHELDPRTQLKGDNDPLDVVELSDESMPTGGVTSIQLIGALALIDEGETDWKMLAIRSDHPAAAHITNARQLQQHWPDKVRTIIDWFRNYKTTDGKPKNEFAFKAEIQDVPLAQRVVWDTHAAWARRLRGEGVAAGDKLWVPSELPRSARSAVAQHTEQQDEWERRQSQKVEAAEYVDVEEKKRSG